MNTVVFDFNIIHTVKKFYSLCKEQLQLPDYFGNNLDALWDCLTSDVAWPITIVFKNVTAFHKQKFSKQISLFNDAAIESGDQIKFIVQEKKDADFG